MHTGTSNINIAVKVQRVVTQLTIAAMMVENTQRKTSRILWTLSFNSNLYGRIVKCCSHLKSQDFVDKNDIEVSFEISCIALYYKDLVDAAASHINTFHT